MSVLLTGTDIQVDVHKGFCSIIVAMIVAPMVGKLIIRLQLLQVVVMHLAIVRFYVWNVIRKPGHTVGINM